MHDELDNDRQQSGGGARLVIALVLVTVMVFAWPSLMKLIDGTPDPKTPDPARTDPSKSDPKSDASKSDPKSDTKLADAGKKADPKADPKSDTKADPKSDPKSDPKADPKTPSISPPPAGNPPAPPGVVPEYPAGESAPGKDPVGLGAAPSADGATLQRDKFRYRALINPARATVAELRLSAFDDRVTAMFDYTGQTPAPMPLLWPAGSLDNPRQAETFQFTRIGVDGKDVPLKGGEWTVLPEESLADGRVVRAFRMTVLRPGDKPLVFRKVFTARPKGDADAPADGRGHLLDVRFEVSTEGTPAKVTFDFLGPVGVPEHTKGDPRQVVWGRRAPDNSGTVRGVYAWDKLVGGFEKDPGKVFTIPEEPDKDKGDTAESLWYVGVVNHFFAAVLMPTRLDGQRARQEIGAPDWARVEVRGYKVPVDPVSGTTKAWSFAPLIKVPELVVGPRSPATVGCRLYVGPKTGEAFAGVEAAADADLALEQIIEYAHFGCCPAACGCDTLIGGAIGKPLMKLLGFLYGIIPNYGVAIVVMVLMVRAVLFPISRKGTLSMLRMKEMQPKLAEIQERYKDDKQLLGQKQMELYQKEGINPIGGCLPMVLQMPIWIGLWGALSAAVDLRHAPFMAWVQDLAGQDALIAWSGDYVIPLFCTEISLPNRLNLLPLLTAVVMFINQKAMTPQTSAQPDNPFAPNPKVMTYMMSGMFLMMLYTAPSGLNLYIMTSMVFGIAENWWVKRHFEDLKARGLLSPENNKPGFFGRMIEKLRAMQEQQMKLQSGDGRAKGGKGADDSRSGSRSDPDASSSRGPNFGKKKKRK